MIGVHDLCVTFGTGAQRLRAVDHVDLTVAEGEVFGLVGESGCGKSTILRAIAGLDSHWTGAIWIDGRRLETRRPKEFFKFIQMVFQDPYGSLHPRKTVNATLLQSAAIHRLDEPNRRIEEVLRAVGLGPSFRFRYPHQLSGGQRQRVAIARALILEPRILLLDEPTSALDVSVQAEILNLLSDIRRRQNLTYILVSHDLAVIDHMCGRLAVMNGGRIVEEMHADDLSAGRFSNPYTAELFEAAKGFRAA